MRRMAEQLGLRALHRIDPEAAHGVAIAALRAGLAPMSARKNGLSTARKARKNWLST